MKQNDNTSRKQESAEAIPNKKPRKRIARPIDRFSVFTDPVEETSQPEQQSIDTEEKSFSEEKPFKDMTIKERVAYFVQQTERWPAIKCEVRTEQHIYRSEEHTSELQSRGHLVCRLLLEKKKNR